MTGNFFPLLMWPARFSREPAAHQRLGHRTGPQKWSWFFVGIGGVLLGDAMGLPLLESFGTLMRRENLVWGAEGGQPATAALPSASEKPSGGSQKVDSEEKPSAHSAGGQEPTGPAAKMPSEKVSPSQEGSLIDQEPYDRIFLDEANGNVVLEVFPLDLPGRQIPAKPTRPLVVRLLNRPDTKYEVAWSAIVKIELFEQRVLQEALQYAQKNQFEEAYKYFQYLYRHYPQMAGLEDGYQEALWQEASFWYQQRQYDRSLAVLCTLWERKKDRPQLDRAMGAVVEKQVEQYVEAEDYPSARTLLRQLAAWYPQHPIVEKWEGQFRTQAAAFQSQAQAALEKNALREASEAARKMLQIWPSLPGAEKLFRQVHQKYPRVVVGVCLPARFAPDHRPASASGRSKSDCSMALTGPGLQAATASMLPPSPTAAGVHQTALRTQQTNISTPQTAPSTDPTASDTKQTHPGPKQFPSGANQPVSRANLTTLTDQVSALGANRKYSDGDGQHPAWDNPWLSELVDWSARRTRRLLCRQWMEMVAPGVEGGQYRSPVASFRIEDLGQRLIFQLRPNLLDAHGQELTGYRLAEVLLDLADPRSVWYRPEWADRVVSVSVHEVYTVEVTLRRAHVRPESLFTFPIADLPGPYQRQQGQQGETVFLQDSRYFALSPGQPMEIVEVAFDRPSLALAALRAGKVDLVDRVPPAELERLAPSKDFPLSQYAIPVVHVLAPNPHRPLPAHPRFRRALDYGIPREAILRQLCGGQLRPGFRVLSAPIPVGATHDDPIGYAYDRTQKARPYNPRLALALARVAWAEVSGTAHALAGQGPGSAPASSQPTSGDISAGQPSASAPVSSQPGPGTLPADQPSAGGPPSASPGPSSSAGPFPQTPSGSQPAPTEKPSEPASPPPEKKRPADPFSDDSSDNPSEEKPSAHPAEEKPSPSPPADPFASTGWTIRFEQLAGGKAGSGEDGFWLAVVGGSGAGGVHGVELPKTHFVSASAEENPVPLSPKAGQPDASGEMGEMPELILVHPPLEPARTACRAIRRALRLVGIPIQLQEVHPAELLGPNPPAFDLAYLELYIQEPVADLPCLLGERGLVGLHNPFLAVSLADLYQAPGWREVRQALYRIHQISLPETPMVPLWQTVEYVVYRSRLQGLGPKPVCLYDNVEAWQILPETASASVRPTEKLP